MSIEDLWSSLLGQKEKLGKAGSSYFACLHRYLAHQLSQKSGSMVQWGESIKEAYILTLGLKTAVRGPRKVRILHPAPMSYQAISGTVVHVHLPSSRHLACHETDMPECSLPLNGGPECCFKCH